MAKETISQGESYTIARLNPEYLGTEKVVLFVDGVTGNVTFKDIAGNSVLAINFSTGAITMTGALVAATPYLAADRPDASDVAVGTSVFNTTDHAPNWSDGTNWRDANGNIT